MKIKPILRTLPLGLLLLALLAAPLTAFAAPVITDVRPSQVTNTTPVTLVITGNGFENGAVVVINDYSALATTFVKPTVLTAELPAGVPPGYYDVTVINPDTKADKLKNGLTVNPAPAETATPAPTAFIRPLVVVQSYAASSPQIVPGSDLDFEITFQNAGQSAATNVVATFAAGDFTPRVTGGLRALGTLVPGATARTFQPLTASSSIAGKAQATLEVKVDYTDVTGTAYSDTFTLTFVVQKPGGGPAATSTPTPTATSAASQRPQLIITSYRSDVDPLQPGTRFNLALDVMNVGTAMAKRVSLILGGGSASGNGGTPDSGGGISGGSGDFSNFAPVNASNVQFLGDVGAGASLSATQTFIVNATTKPGAYPMKISFVYVDPKGNSFTDDQAITLLVYQLPQVEISFYRDPGPLFAFQPNLLPIQVVNLGRSSVVLGNVEVTTDGSAQFSNNVILVGALDVGGFFPLDATVIPDTPGPLQLNITVEYTDDFNQAQTITKTIDVDVLESGGEFGPDNGGIGPEGGGVIPTPSAPETIWQKIWRFIKGLLGLGSEQPTPAPLEILPSEEIPFEIQPGGGGGGNIVPAPTEAPVIIPPKG